MEKKNGRPPAFTSPKELEEKLDNYFAQFEVKGCKDIPEWTDLMNFLGVHRDTIHVYSSKQGYSDPIKNAKQKCEAFIAKGIMKGELNATGGIFNLKHNYGWKDRQELEHSGSIATPSINVTVVQSGPELATSEKEVK